MYLKPLLFISDITYLFFINSDDIGTLDVKFWFPGSLAANTNRERLRVGQTIPVCYSNCGGVCLYHVKVKVRVPSSRNNSSCNRKRRYFCGFFYGTTVTLDLLIS